MARKIASRRGPAIALAMLAIATVSPPAGASDPKASVQRAQTLFDEARELMKAGKYAEACPKLEESQALDPGGGTLLNLGICRLREGRSATAFAVLTDALSQARVAGRADRVATAEKHLAELTPILSRIVVRVTEEAPPPDLAIEIDGKPLAHGELGVALPFDPGPHTVRASRPGHTSREFELTLGPSADVQTIDVPPLAPETAAAPPALTLLPPPVVPEARPPDTTERPAAAESSPNWLGYTLVGAGGAALVAGGIFGARALSLKAKSDEYYDEDSGHCTQQSCVDDWEDGKTAATISNVFIGLGIASAGVGVYVLLSSPTKERAARAASFSLRTSRSGASATGTFEF
jgi:hypothetical protein